MSQARAHEATGRAGPGRRRGRTVLLGLIAVLYGVSVPWYRDAEDGLRVVLGLPDWVAVAVLCYSAVAVLNSLAWWLTDVDDDGPLPASLDAPPRAGAGRSGE